MCTRFDDVPASGFDVICRKQRGHETNGEYSGVDLFRCIVFIHGIGPGMQAEKADATITLTRDTLNQILLGQTTNNL